MCVGSWGFFFFSFRNSFLTPAFLWSQSNLSWKGSLNAIWSKLCSNQVTKVRAAHAMLVALGITKARSSAAEAPCLSWASNTRVCRRFCSLPCGMGHSCWRQAFLQPALLLWRPGCHADCCLCCCCCWGDWVLGFYHVRETVITSWWVLVFKSISPKLFHPWKGWNMGVLSYPVTW